MADSVASIAIVIGLEEDGRWWADVESMPGVMSYGVTREAAISSVQSLALRVAADWMEQGEPVPAPMGRLFRVA